MKQEQPFDITYTRTVKGVKNQETIRVLPLPGTRKKIVVEESTGYLYWYDTTRERWCRIRDGIYSAYRMIAEMQTTHRQEMPVIEDIAEKTAMLQDEIGVVTIATSDRDKESILPAIREAAYHLKQAIDQNKADARGQYYALLLWRDSKGRVNSGVFACRNATAVRRLRARMKAVSSMKPWLAYYQTSLGEIIRDIQKTLEGVQIRLEKAIRLEEGMWTSDASGKKHPNPYQRFNTLLAESFDLLQYIPPLAPHSRATKLLREDIEEMLITAKKDENTHEVLSAMLKRTVDVIAFRTQRMYIEAILSDVRLCMRMPELWTKARRKNIHQRITNIQESCQKILPRDWKRPKAHERCLNMILECLQLIEEDGTRPKKIHAVLKQAARI